MPARSTLPLAGTPARCGHQRWVVCALLFVATAINYMDRQVLGLLAPDLEQRFGWSESTYANLVTAFQVAYVLGLVAAGPLLLRLGTRLGYACSVGVWSLAIAAHALATGTLGFAAVRTVLGVGEAGNPISGNSRLAVMSEVFGWAHDAAVALVSEHSSVG